MAGATADTVATTTVMGAAGTAMAGAILHVIYAGDVVYISEV